MSLYGPLAKLEEERRQRRIADLERRFQMTLRHMDEMAKVNEEAYKAKKAVMEAGVTRREPPKPAPVKAKSRAGKSIFPFASGKKRSK